MVLLLIKKGEKASFLLNASTHQLTEDLVQLCTELHNLQLKISRLADELVELAEHGVSMPPSMQGLNDDQIIELKLRDDYADVCIPSGGFQVCKDDMARRNGRAPLPAMAEVLKKAACEAREMISAELIEQSKILTEEQVKQALAILNGAVMIVYPMGLPPYDPIKQEFDNEEALEGTQAGNEVIPPAMATLWFCGKELLRGKRLFEFIGKNEKSKIVMKLAKKGQGQPAREPIVSEDEQRAMMAYYYRKQEEWKKLEQDDRDDLSHLDSAWADPNKLKRDFHGLNNIKWGPR